MEKVKGSRVNKQAKAPNIAEGHVLTWEVFVTPGIPIVTAMETIGLAWALFLSDSQTP